MSSQNIEYNFPALQKHGYSITSPPTPNYNCIAWAAGDPNKWWWPVHVNGYYWPPNLPRIIDLDIFIDAFKSLGYSPCGSSELEIGFEKVAVYTDKNGKPTHAARQLPSGRWTSKLGNLEDIEHNALMGVEGKIYGNVAKILKRTLSKSK